MGLLTLLRKLKKVGSAFLTTGTELACLVSGVQQSTACRGAAGIVPTLRIVALLTVRVVKGLGPLNSNSSLCRDGKKAVG